MIQMLLHEATWIEICLLNVWIYANIEAHSFLLHRVSFHSKIDSRAQGSSD